jgi:hypothetical protein
MGTPWSSRIHPPTPLPYPYGVPGLPADGTTRAGAIQAEVARMAGTLGAISDLSWPRAYQAAQEISTAPGRC